ncbi:Leucine-rich repeat-containing protein 63 [Phlyctochytrium planicorne]|nr:Leucine-rich repeat-containing protein 63 [Phlyctochytrium planicorne]
MGAGLSRDQAALPFAYTVVSSPEDEAAAAASAAASGSDHENPALAPAPAVINGTNGPVPLSPTITAAATTTIFISPSSPIASSTSQSAAPAASNHNQRGQSSTGGNAQQGESMTFAASPNGNAGNHRHPQGNNTSASSSSTSAPVQQPQSAVAAAAAAGATTAASASSSSSLPPSAVPAELQPARVQTPAQMSVYSMEHQMSELSFNNLEEDEDEGDESDEGQKPAPSTGNPEGTAKPKENITSSSSASSSSFFLRHSVSLDELGRKAALQGRDDPNHHGRAADGGHVPLSSSTIDLLTTRSNNPSLPGSPRQSSNKRLSALSSSSIGRLFSKKKDPQLFRSASSLALSATASGRSENGATTPSGVDQEYGMGSRSASLSPSMRFSRPRTRTLDTTTTRDNDTLDLGQGSSSQTQSQSQSQHQQEQRSSSRGEKPGRHSLLGRHRKEKALSKSSFNSEELGNDTTLEQLGALDTSSGAVAPPTSGGQSRTPDPYHPPSFEAFAHHYPHEGFLNPYSDVSLEDVDVEAMIEDKIPIDSVLMTRKELKPITFGQLTSLATIGLCSQDIMFMSPNMGLLFMTTTLELCCNKLSVIPAEIGYMKSLKILSVARNNLTYLPDTIGHLQKLVELRASENQLTCIPTSVGELTKLTILHLESNRITSLPSELGGNKSLVTLDISSNPIRTIPAEVGRLKFLRRLRVEDCTELLTEFVHDVSWSAPTLRELAARVIVRHQLPILECTQEDLKRYLASAHSCSFCNGPYFESYVVRGKIVEKADVNVPFEYRLCIPHWNTEKERQAALFRPLPDTAPSPSPSPAPSFPPSNANSPKPSPPGSPSANGNRSRGASSGSGGGFAGGRRRRTSISHVASSSQLQQQLQPLNTTNTAVSMTPTVSLPLSSISKTPSLPALFAVSDQNALGSGSGVSGSTSSMSTPNSPRNSLRSKIFARRNNGLMGSNGLKHSQSLDFTNHTN